MTDYRRSNHFNRFN